MAETTPQEVSQPVSVEDKLAAAFERAGMKDDPPEDTDPADEPEDDDSPEPEDDDPEAQAQPGETDEEPGDGEEVEFEGKAYKLPKELKDAVLRQKDYTQKTQQVAEQRRVVETQAEALKAEAEFNKTNFEKVVQAHALGAQLQQFAQIDWSRLAREDSAQYLSLDRQQRDLQDAFNRVQADVQNAANGFQQTKQQAKQKAQALCVEALKKDFPDFGTEFLKNLDDTGKAYGFSGEELASIVDPRMVRVLHAAMQYKKLQGSKSLVAKKVQDARPVQVKGARSAQTSQANAQLQSLKQQLQKTGKTKDAEAFLAARFAKAMR